MDAVITSQLSPNNTAPPVVADRRSFPRYRFSAPITVHTREGETAFAITIEISESGLSALAGKAFHLGERLELEPVGGDRVSAVVRRVVGRLYGFEFLGLNAEQLGRIRERCKRLPLFKGEKIGV